MVGREVRSSSLAQHSTTNPFSCATVIMRLKSLSSFWKRPATRGMLRAMSPPRNTDSSDDHMSCTLSHSSRMSAVSDSVLSSSCADSRNGATARDARMVCKFSCASSRFSTTPSTPCSTGTPRAFHSVNTKRSVSHRSVRSFILISMASCLSARSHSSSMASLFSTSGAASSCASVNPASCTGSAVLVTAAMASQWWSRSDGLDSSCSSGSTVWKSSMRLDSARKAGQARSFLGSALQRDEKAAVSVDMASTLATTSDHKMVLHSSMRVITSLYRPYSLPSSASSRSVASSSANGVTGSAKSVSPPLYSSRLRCRSSYSSSYRRRRSMASLGGRPSAMGPCAR